MKIAYIISAYRYPEQLIRLVTRLSTERTSFFIHVDQKTDDKIYHQMVDGLSHLPNIHFLKRHRCYWGDFGHVAATIKGIQEIFRLNISFDWVVLLTGQDYPIKSNEQIEEFFSKNAGKSFMESEELPRPIWPNGGFARIQYWHFCLFNRHFIFPAKLWMNTYNYSQIKQDIGFRIAAKLWFALILWFPIKRKFPQGFKPFGGSSYWCLSRDCVNYVHSFIQQNPAFVNFFKYVDVPDEMFFQTIVLNSPFKDTVIDDTLKYEDWENPNPMIPAVLDKSDFDKLLKVVCQKI